MSKISLIAQREYLVRVKKKSFLLMTFLGPLLFAGLFGVSIWAASRTTTTKTIVVLDESGRFENKLKDSKKLKFTYTDGSLSEAQERLRAEEQAGLLYVPPLDLEDPRGVKLFVMKGVGLDTQLDLERRIESTLENEKLLESGIDRATLDGIKTNISLDVKKLVDSGEAQDSNTGLQTGVGFVGAFLIYFFIFLYGVQIMRGVIEEKVSRIVEVIISSMKPFELMAGKIIGIALVGLTQFLLWVILTGALYTVLLNVFGGGTEALAAAQTAQAAEAGADLNGMQKFSSALDGLNIFGLLAAFLFYFLGGYLLYGSLFAAVGAAVDSETDTQQFMLPITIPLVLSIVVAQLVVRDPYSPLAFWFSMVPFTSPIMMMIRLPFGVPIWELLLSMALLVGGFLFTTWLAGRIYRVGILMYGKKVSYRELSKWIFYRG
ncbi:MAG: ABC transporter permease [Catalinimonas sp.]